MVDVPHLAYPFRVGPGRRAAVVEQDSADEVTQNVVVLLQTRVGTRLEIPEYGTDSLLFQVQGESDLSDVLAQVTEWEPRATIVFEDNPDALDDLVRQVRLSVTTTTSGGST